MGKPTLARSAGCTRSRCGFFFGSTQLVTTCADHFAERALPAACASCVRNEVERAWITTRQASTMNQSRWLPAFAESSGLGIVPMSSVSTHWNTMLPAAQIPQMTPILRLRMKEKFPDLLDEDLPIFAVSESELIGRIARRSGQRPEAVRRVLYEIGVFVR